jgi:hypothetical protein
MDPKASLFRFWYTTTATHPHEIFGVAPPTVTPEEVGDLCARLAHDAVLRSDRPRHEDLGCFLADMPQSGVHLCRVPVMGDAYGSAGLTVRRSDPAQSGLPLLPGVVAVRPRGRLGEPYVVFRGEHCCDAKAFGDLASALRIALRKTAGPYQTGHEARQFARLARELWAYGFAPIPLVEVHVRQATFEERRAGFTGALIAEPPVVRAHDFGPRPTEFQVSREDLLWRPPSI